MEPTPDQARRIETLLRLGTIADIDHDQARVRVATGGLTTDWLPWHTGRAGATRQWSPPTVGEQVMVLSPSGEMGAGIVLTGLYSDANGAPSGSPDVVTTVYPDGATVTYDHAQGVLSATGIKTAHLAAQSAMTIDCPYVHITGTLTVDTDVIGGGVSLKSHRHGQTQPGSGQTGTPAN
jgi:phage baseplate assembly protein V